MKERAVESLTFCGTFYVNYRPRFVGQDGGEYYDSNSDWDWDCDREEACHADDDVVCPPGR